MSDGNGRIGALGRNWHVFLAVLLPVSVTGTLYLPHTPPPLGRLFALALAGEVLAATFLTILRTDRAVALNAARVSVAIFLALLYPAFGAGLGVPRLSTQDAVLSAAYVAAVAAGLVALRRISDGTLRELRTALNAVAPAMLAVTAAWGWSGYVLGPPEGWRGAVDALTAPIFLGPATPDDPDIVHVVFDGLGRPDVLREKYGLDLDEQLRELGTLGAHVERDAVANYSITYLSLASMLNAAYLDPLTELMGPSADRRPLEVMIQRSSVIRALKARGYEFLFVGSSYAAADDHDLADQCFCRSMPLSELEAALLAITPARCVPVWPWMYASHRGNVLRALERLRLPASPGSPRFMLAHVLAPHPPFLFRGSGAPAKDPTWPYGLHDGTHYHGTREDYIQGYSAQTTFIVNSVVDLVRVFRGRQPGDRPVVFIASGDHGPGLDTDVRNVSRIDVDERLPIGLVTYSSVPGRRVSATSPVNLYRALFDSHLGGSLSPLPARAYVSAFEQPYLLTEVPVARLRGSRSGADRSATLRE